MENEDIVQCSENDSMELKKNTILKDTEFANAQLRNVRKILSIASVLEKYGQNPGDPRQFSVCVHRFPL